MAAVKTTSPSNALNSAGGATYVVYDASGQRITFVTGTPVAGSKTIVITNYRNEQIVMTQQNVTDMIAVLTTFSTTGVVV